jgi:hypothetical protein
MFGLVGVRDFEEYSRLARVISVWPSREVIWPVTSHMRHLELGLWPVNVAIAQTIQFDSKKAARVI